MPWIDTEFDHNLETEIIEFKNKNLPIIYDLLQKYKSDKTIVIFKDRNEADTFIENIKCCEK